MSSEHPSPITLDLRWLKALPEKESTDVDEHLATCARCRSSVDFDEQARRKFTSEVFPRSVGRLRVRRTRRWWIFAVAPAAALATLAVCVALRAPEITAKGGPALFVYGRHEGRVAAVRDGDAIHPGDEIRFAVVAGDYSQVMVASIDSADHASIYFPFDGTTSGEVARHERVELPGSVILDETLGPERVYALFSRRPLTAASVAAALRAVGQDGPDAIRRARDLATGADAQITVLIEKVQ